MNDSQLNIPIDDSGALMFPYAVKVDGNVKIARCACQVCFPDGRVTHIGFVVSPRGTAHIPMPDGATVCNHDMEAGGWWYHDVVGHNGVGIAVKTAAQREP